jgi:hypothetical protein
MAVGSDDTRLLIGLKSKETVLEIQKESIKQLTDAIRYPNPLYHDEEYARKPGYGNILATGSFLFL